MTTSGGVRAAVITVSDEVASGADADRGGPVAVGLLGGLGLTTSLTAVPDDPEAVVAAVQAAIRDGARVVLACGGTGIGPRDRTPEAVRSLLAFEIPGIAEEIRRRGLAHTAQALVSREVAGAVTPRGRPAVLVVA
ncbi:MAG: molybdopterin-binding protein, partial [Propionicimonas sp.]|nr:molybdopterin-binding protein [Propionicimonas sp.]